MRPSSTPGRSVADVVRFRVRKSSPALPDFPASELESQKTGTKGYITATEPAEIILELLQGKYDLTQLQLLSHESNIASRIEIYALEGSSTSFRPLGFMELDDNTRSGYLARELQCVALECTDVSQVRLVMSKPHVNELNPQGHMGIIALNLLGMKNSEPANPASATVIEAPSAPAAKLLQPPSNKDNIVNVGSDSIASLFQRAEELRKAKEAAVAREDFDEAKKLKAAEAESRRLADLAGELEKAKAEAVANEDYEEAKRIKERQMAILGGKGAPLQASRASTEEERPIKAASPHRQIISPSASAASRPVSPPVPAHGKAISPLKGYTDEEGPPPGFWSGVENGDSLPVAEPLDVHLQNTPEVGILMQAFGKYGVRCLYSANIKLRAAMVEKAGKHVADKKTAADAGLDHVEAVLIVGGRALQEQAVHMILSGLKLLDDALDQVAPNPENPKGRRLLQQHHTQFEQTIMPALLDATANSSSHVQKAALDLFMRIARLFGAEFAVKLVLSRSASAKRSTLWRPFFAKLTVLSELVNLNDFDPFLWNIQLLEWMKTGGAYAHANDQVRDAAMDLTVALYKKARDPLEVEDYLRANLRPASLEKYLLAFAKADGKASSRSTASPAKGARNETPARRAVVEEEEEIESEAARDRADSASICHFCHTRDEAFRDSEDALDFHMWRNCPMLGHCPHCNQVIEICNLNEHLLVECDHRHNHRSCPRCTEAIAAQSFEKHVRRNACLKAKPKSEANRCPLCHHDIPPFAEGWRQHLMVDICPNNVRTMADDDEEDDEDLDD